MISRRGFIQSGAGLLFSSLFLSCPRPPTQDENLSPNIFVSKTFDNKGNVTYTFSGSDSDGSISYIGVQINGSVKSIDNDKSLTVPVIQGSNTVKANAYDNEGLASIQSVSSFTPLNDNEAKIRINDLLIPNANTFSNLEKNVLLSLGEKDNFSIDFLIKKKDNTDAVINYVGFEKNLGTEISNSRKLSDFSILNLYLFRLPDNEIISRVNDFIVRGYG